MAVAALAAAAAAFQAAPAIAQPPAACEPCRAEEFVRTLPASYEAVVVVRGAARQRALPAGHSLAAMLDDSGAFPETVRAWRDLATALAWPGDLAFDELLGRKVSIVVRGLESGHPDWAVMTEVSTATERRLRDRLQAAPRGAIAGLPVLAVEDGRFELVIGRQVSQVDVKLTGAPEPSSIVLLGPGGDNPLLAELAPMLHTHAGLAGSAPVLGPGGRACDVLLVLRQPGPDRAGTRSLCLAATSDSSGWEAQLVCSPGMIWDRPAGTEVKPWSEGAFTALEREALVAIMGPAGSTTLSGFGGLPLISRLVPDLPFQFNEPSGRLAGVFIRPSKAGGGAEPRPGTPASVTAMAADIRSAPRALEPETAPSGYLSMAFAVQAPNSQAAAAEGDHFVARFLGLLQGGEIGELLPSVRRAPAVSDHALRSLPLDGAFPIQAEYQQLLERGFGDDPVLTWGATCAPAVAAGLPKGDAGAWWVVSVSPQGAATAGRDLALLSAPDAGKPKPRLSMGVVRPAAAARWGRGGGVALLKSLLPLRRIETLRWDAWLRSDGAVEAAVSVRMAR